MRNDHMLQVAGRSLAVACSVHQVFYFFGSALRACTLLVTLCYMPMRAAKSSYPFTPSPVQRACTCFAGLLAS